MDKSKTSVPTQRLLNMSILLL